MCGIFALLLNHPLTEADIALGRAGTLALAHRGPDDCGEWMDADKGVYLGHRRLSIIDLGAGGHQPMTHGDHVLAFNGEIYNFPDLRRELQQRGRAFTSHSDTEVLLQAIGHWGEPALDRLDGMFAFVHWDGTRAVLAVDPFGEKPLYWAETTDGLYVSSEIAPLARLLRAEPRLEPEDWAAYLALGYIPAPRTAYRGISRMTPASVMEVRRGRPGAARRYWSAPRPEPAKGPVRPVEEAGLDRLAASLTRSLERRLVADVPVTLFLSGGIDSGLVAALARRELNRDLECITVAFPGGEVRDESQAAAGVANHLGLSHRIIVNEERAGGIDRMADLFGQPCGNAAILPIDLISRVASESCKVALTGMGGDEATWGYDKAAHYWKWRRLYAAPDSLRAAAGRILAMMGGRLGRAGKRIVPGRHELYLANKNFPALDWLRSVPGFNDWSRRIFNGDRPLELAVPWFDSAEAMPNMQLLASDHASMRHGLELRTPFLSCEVFAAIAEFDARALLAFGQKSLLRRLLGRYLPKPLFDRPKTGFVFPLNGIVQSGKEAPLRLPGFADDLVRAAWSHRNEGGGWDAIAVRLLAAEAFFAPQEDAEGVPLGSVSGRRSEVATGVRNWTTHSG